MEHRFTLQAGGHEFRLNSMNVKNPSLFQVYISENGVEKRYHMKLNKDQFVFTLREDCPRQLLELEEDFLMASDSITA